MCICPLLNHRYENIILKTSWQLDDRESLPRPSRQPDGSEKKMVHKSSF